MNTQATLEPPADRSALFAYKLKGGAIVHPLCREGYVKKHHTSSCNYPSIEAGLHPGYQMPSGRFQLCDHCQAPIWDAPNHQKET